MPRQKEPPTPDDVYEAMAPGECYVAADLRNAFADAYSPSHSTIRNRLAELVAERDVIRRTHSNGTVTFRRENERGEATDASDIPKAILGSQHVSKGGRRENSQEEL